LIYIDLGRTNHQVLIIGATSKLGSIDTALRRPGRFDEDIALGIPDEPTREKILKVLCRNLPADPYLDWKYLTTNTCDFVGADLMVLVHKATKVATNRFREKNCCDQQPLTDDQLKPLFISTEDFKQAMECVKPSV
jgi:transitional endoplasmic reticulum ATPase